MREKSRWGSLQSLRASSSMDLSRRVEEIDRQLQVESQISEVLQKMQIYIERISSSSLSSEIVHLLQRELDDLRKKVEGIFGGLRKEQAQVGMQTIN